MDADLIKGGTTTRKVSMVVNLSDPNSYDGGTFELGAVPRPHPDQLRQQGTVFVFPSFIEHGVSPVTRGERWSLVAWFSGDNWK